MHLLSALSLERVANSAASGSQRAHMQSIEQINRKAHNIDQSAWHLSPKSKPYEVGRSMGLTTPQWPQRRGFILDHTKCALTWTWLWQYAYILTFEVASKLVAALKRWQYLKCKCESLQLSRTLISAKTGIRIWFKNIYNKYKIPWFSVLNRVYVLVILLLL